MTGPNPDAELDAALGIDKLPPATVTDEHRRRGAAFLDEVMFGGYSHDGANEAAARFDADAEQRGAARTLTAHAMAGAPLVDAELAGVPGAEAPGVELANIRRLVARHGIPPADGNGEIRSTVAMVEELAISRPPRP